MANNRTITTARTVEIYREAVSVRRSYCRDNDFFKMSDLWRFLCGEDTEWKIKEYPGKEVDGDKRKAGVITLGNALTLLVDADLKKDRPIMCLQLFDIWRQGSLSIWTIKNLEVLYDQAVSVMAKHHV